MVFPSAHSVSVHPVTPPCMYRTTEVAEYTPATMLRRPLSLALLALLAAEMPDAAQAFAPSSLRAFGAAKAQLPAVLGPRGNVLLAARVMLCQCRRRMAWGAPPARDLVAGGAV